MNRSFQASIGGALGGVVVAIVAVAMSAGLVIDGAAGFTVVDNATGAGRGTLTAGTDAMYLYLLAFGLVGGGAIAFITAALAQSTHPDESRFRPGPVSVVGAIAGAVTAYVTLRAGIGIGGEIDNEVITISAYRGVVIFMLAGAAAGAVSAFAAEKLSQPATLGLAGEAWPTTAAAFVRESMPAMLIPLIALTLIAGVIIGIAQLLLAGGTVGAIVGASALSAAILGGAAFLAYRRDGTAVED